MKGDGIERILCAAIWFNDGNQYTYKPKNVDHGLVLTGYRHCSIYEQIGGLVSERKKLGIYEKEQGFLTNFNRFVNREEAAKIAFSARQIDRPLITLYSEDLY